MRETVQSMTANTWVAILFATENYDNLGEYNTTNGRFTATEAGYYQVSWSTLLEQTAWALGDVWHTAIYKNGVIHIIGLRNEVQAAHTGYLTSSGSDVVYLAAGDYIQIFGHVTHSAAVNLYPSGIYNYFSVHRLS